MEAGKPAVPVGTPIEVLLNRCGVLPDTKLVYIGPAIAGEAVTDLTLPVTQRTRCITALKQQPINKTYACIDAAGVPGYACGGFYRGLCMM